MEKVDNNDPIKAVVYGGNGFVGTRVARQLSERDVATVCVSRTGHKPIHLKDEEWSQSVRWCKGDASDPAIPLLESASILITLVGSPPLPTFSKQAYQQQVFMNGTTNANVIRAAGDAGIRRVVLLSAKIPLPLRGDWFGYSKGKHLAEQAALEFSQLSPEHRVTVFKPGVIYGTRHLANGKSMPLGTVMKPLSYFMPWQFVSVDQVAIAIVDAALNKQSSKDPFTIINHSDI